VFHISIWGAWSIVLGAKPTKTPVATGLPGPYVKKAEKIGRIMMRKVTTSRKIKTRFILCVFDYSLYLK